MQTLKLKQIKQVEEWQEFVVISARFKTFEFLQHAFLKTIFKAFYKIQKHIKIFLRKKDFCTTKNVGNSDFLDL